MAAWSGLTNAVLDDVIVKALRDPEITTGMADVGLSEDDLRKVVLGQRDNLLTLVTPEAEDFERAANSLVAAIDRSRLEADGFRGVGSSRRCLSRHFGLDLQIYQARSE